MYLQVKVTISPNGICSMLTATRERPLCPSFYTVFRILYAPFRRMAFQGGFRLSALQDFLLVFPPPYPSQRLSDAQPVFPSPRPLHVTVQQALVHPIAPHIGRYGCVANSPLQNRGPPSFLPRLRRITSPPRMPPWTGHALSALPPA